MRKTINFDIDTKKYTQLTNKPAPTAYYEIRRFLENNNFIHRQGSGYLSKYSMKPSEVTNLVNTMSKNFPWLRYCIKAFDVTNVGKQYSLINTIKEAEDKTLSCKNDFDIDKEPDIVEDMFDL